VVTGRFTQPGEATDLAAGSAINVTQRGSRFLDTV
jgi:hypothetical protein